MRERGVGEHVVDDARALAALLRPAQHDIGDAQPPAHHAEGVAHGQQRRVVVGADGVEQREQRRFPAGILGDALRPRRDAVVEARIQMAGAAGADVDRVPPAGRSRNLVSAAHVVGQAPARAARPSRSAGVRSHTMFWMP